LINPRSKISQVPLVRKATRHWFLRFDHFKDKLTEWIGKKEWKSNVVNFVKSYIDDLKPRAITRDMEWGVPLPLPGTEGKVLYVWFDAPIGYISATQEWAQLHQQPDAWKDYWLDPHTTLVNFIGKDNIPFHAIFFPAMIMGQNIPYKLVDQLPANEFYNLEGRQFSKSDNWTIDLESFFNQFTSDQIRYTIAANAPENQDSEFSWKDFQLRCNSELLSKYGNFVNRTLAFLQSQCEGKIPPLTHPHPIDLDFLQKIKELGREADQAYAHFQLRRAAQLIMEIAQAGNAYFDAKKPWVAARSALTHHDMQVTISCCLECIKCMALISSPIIPDAADKIWNMLGFTTPLHAQKWDEVLNAQLPEGRHLTPPEVLFKRVEDSAIQQEIQKLHQLHSH
jgi:methionyl-tRNA synthetase